MDNSGNPWDNPNQNQWNQQGEQNTQWNQQNQWNNGGYQTPPPVQRQPIFQNGVLNRTILKEDAKAIFKQNYGNALAASIIPSLIAGVLTLIPIVGGFISWFFTPILYVGGYFLLLELVRGFQQVKTGDMFNIFGDFGNVFGAAFMTRLFIGLWSLLLVVPGIYKAYSWAMVQFILADNPKMSGTDARNLSNTLMEGHRMELFVLQLSYIGWALLSAVTFGIFGLFYLNPWYQTSIADYYDNLKMLYEARQQQAY